MRLDFICIDPERQLDRARESAIGALATLPVDVVFLHIWLPLALQRQHVLLQADGYIIAGYARQLGCAESARGVSPRAAHRSGLDTLASSGSCHRTKAAASRRELELLLLPVGSLPTSVTCPLRSTGITPLPRYYGAVRPCPPHRYFRPRSFPACTFSLGIAGQVLKFRTRARTRVMPPIHRAPRGQ